MVEKLGDSVLDKYDLNKIISKKLINLQKD
jgi:hypothetical protein